MFSTRADKIERVVILHGYAGNTADHWQTWLAKTCRANGLEVHYPDLPNNMNPSLAEWLQCLENENVIFDAKTAVICHSLGCALAFQYLQKPDVKKLGLLILAAPTSRSKLAAVGLSTLEHFYDNITIDLIAPKLISSQLYYSDNDVYVDINEAKTLAFDLRANAHLVVNGGHLNVASGHTSFPEIIDTLNPSSALAAAIQKPHL